MKDLSQVKLEATWFWFRKPFLSVRFALLCYLACKYMKYKTVVTAMYHLLYFYCELVPKRNGRTTNIFFDLDTTKIKNN